jgi:hypothetical protein
MFSGFLGTNCTNNALAAIRAAFHDCFSEDGGCDGSLVLAQEYKRTENDGLADISVKLGNLTTRYCVGTANMIRCAGGKVVLLVLLSLFRSLFFLHPISLPFRPPSLLSSISIYLVYQRSFQPINSLISGRLKQL